MSLRAVSGGTKTGLLVPSATGATTKPTYPKPKTFAIVGIVVDIQLDEISAPIVSGLVVTKKRVCKSRTIDSGNNLGLFEDRLLLIEGHGGRIDNRKTS